MTSDSYIWRTVGDGNVRQSHAERAGKIFSFKDSPRPGEEPGCRCWAESVPERNTSRFYTNSGSYCSNIWEATKV